MDEKKYFEEIDITKGFAILLAVIGHSFPDAEIGWKIVGKDSFAFFLEKWIYSFHMPVFFLFAGFLFIPRLHKMGVGATLLKRFNRLMLPYLFFSILYILIKTIGASYANHPLSQNFWVEMLLGVSPANGCWFLWVLFVMSLICVVFRKIGTYGLLILSVLMAVISFIDSSWMIGQIKHVFHDFVWFALGGVLANYYDVVKSHLNKAVIGILAFVVLTCLRFVAYFPFKEYVITLSGIIMMFYLGIRISETGENVIHNVAKTLGLYCMDIYILSMLTVIPLRVLYINFHFSNYVPYYLWLVFVSVLGCVIPIILSKYIVRKNKWLSMFVIGR